MHESRKRKVKSMALIKSKKMRSTFSKLLKFSLAGGLIYWLIQKGLLDLSVLKQILTPQHISVLMVIVFINLVLNNYRWSLLLESQKLPGRFSVTFPLSLVGLFFNFAVPGAVGGDLVKAFYVARDFPGRKMAAATTVMMDRIIGLYSMVWLAVLSMLVHWQMVWERSVLRHIFISSLLIAVLMTVVLGLMFSPTVKAKNPLLRWVQRVPGGEFCNRFYDAIHAYGNHLKIVTSAFLISLVSQVVAIAFMAYVGFALGGNVSLATYFFAVPLGFIVMALPISPAGVGVGQVAFLVLFRLFSGETSVLGQTVITTFQVGMFCWSLVGAFLYAQRKQSKELQDDENQNQGLKVI